MTRIIFVDDEPCVLSGLQRMLFDREDEWEMEFVSSGKEAIAAFEQQPFDVIVSDMRMPEMDGSQLVMAIQERWPDTVRIILSGQAEKETVLRSIGPSHRFLPKPCESRVLFETITRALELHSQLGQTAAREMVAAVTALPDMPRLFHLLVNQMRTPEPSPERVADLIADNAALTSKLLLIANSALQDRTRRFGSVLEVVRAIGVERLRPLILSAGIFSRFDGVPLLMDQSQQFVNHSATVSRLAQAIVERELPGDNEAIGIALLGGLIHDVGKLVLSQRLGDQYQQLIHKAAQSGRPLQEVEQAELNIDHAACGAYLLNLWGLPDGTVEVVAHHHWPSRSQSTKFSPLTAVHVANEFEYATRTGQAPRWDLEYLERLGVVGKLERWKSLMPTNCNSWFYPAMMEGSRADLTLSSSSLMA